MADILIRGIGIPSKSDLVVHIYPDGKAIFYPFHSKPRKVEVLELPPHGDLIDRDAVVAEIKKDDTYQNWIFRKMLKEQPVVVPAERREET